MVISWQVLWLNRSAEVRKIKETKIHKKSLSIFTTVVFLIALTLLLSIQCWQFQESSTVTQSAAARACQSLLGLTGAEENQQQNDFQIRYRLMRED